MKTKFGILYFAFFLILFSCQNDQNFNSELWKSNDTLRPLMVDHLIKSKILENKSKIDVQFLLGQNCKHCDLESDSWMYYIQITKGITNPDIQLLDISFQNGKVESATIRK